MYDSKDPRGYGWKQHEGKFIPVWFQSEPLPTLKAIETLEETSTRDVKLKKGDEYVKLVKMMRTISTNSIVITAKTMTANNNRFCKI